MTGENEKHEDTTEALATSLTKPLSARLLSTLARRPALTSRQLAETVGEPVHKVNYQVRELLNRGLVVVAVQAERRGALERRFEVTRQPFLSLDEERGFPFAQLRRVRANLLRLILDDVTSSLRQVLVRRDGDSLMRLEMDVDRPGWDELAAIFVRSRAEVLEVWDRSRARLAEGGAETLTVTSAIVLLELPVAHLRDEVRP